MAIYTVGRRQVIVALLLTAALLLTLDLRGNPVLDTIRDGFARAMSPVERAADVVSQPAQRAWNSYNNYDDLERENENLRELLARQAGTEAAAAGAILDYQLLLELNNLPSLSGIETEKAQVVGGASNNIDQVVEINKGSNQGIEVGMPVVNQAGLIGKITRVFPNTSRVMLITDPRYAVAVEILSGLPDSDGEVTAVTTPSGRTDDENDAAATPTTTPLDVLDDNELPQFEDLVVPATDVTTTLPPEEEAAEEGEFIPDDSPAETTTTTVAPSVELEQAQKEFGTLEGRGANRPSQIRFVQDSPSLAVLEVGDLVETAGGSESLAPPNIPVGVVINRAPRPGVAGPLLEIDLHADLDNLNFVRVVLFRPLSEVEQ